MSKTNEDFITRIMQQELTSSPVLVSPLSKAVADWNKRPWYKRLFGKRKYIDDRHRFYKNKLFGDGSISIPKIGF